MSFDGSSGLPGRLPGPPASTQARPGVRPGGEELSQHATAQAGGEASSEKLANPSSLGSGGPLEPSTKIRKGRKRTKTEGEVCRATCRFRVEPRKHNKAECGGVESCNLCYLDAALCEARDLIKRASNVAMRDAYRRESDWLDAFQFEHGRMPGKGEGNWLAPVKGQLYPYPIIRRIAPTLSSHVAAALSERITADWKNWRWEILVREGRAPAHYKPANTVIPIPAQTFTLTHVEGDKYHFAFSLHSMDAPVHRRLIVPIQAKDEHQRFVLAQIASGAWRKGVASIQEDGERPGRWYLRIAYKRVIEPVPRSGRVAAINRGLLCFFAVVTHTGEDWVYDGHEIIAHLKQTQARRREFQNGLATSNRGGHGRNRALAPTDKIQGATKRWRHDKIHVLAAVLGEWLVERDICRVYIEDFTGIRHNAHERLGSYIGQLVQEWPFYMLEQVIRSKLEELGIEVVSVPSRNEQGGIAETCVACGNVDRKSLDYARRSYACMACGFRRHLDVATAMNVLVRGERSCDGPSAGVARKPDFLRSRAPLRGPSTNAVMALPEVREGRKGAARKAPRKRRES